MAVEQSSPPECRVPVVEVTVTEELDLASVAEVGLVLDRILSLSPDEVVIDLSECRHVDAGAIGLLLDVHRRLARRGAVLTVRDPNPRIRRILQTARLDQVLRVAVTAPAVGGDATLREHGITGGPVQGRAPVTVRR